MSAFGPKQTLASAPHRTCLLSGVKRTWPFAGGPLSRSLLGVKQTWRFAAHMSAYDPKRTSAIALHIVMELRLAARFFAVGLMEVTS